MESKELEKLLFLVIANAGESRSDSKAAMEAAKSGDYEEAERMLKSAEETMLTAHKAHTEILYSSVNAAEMPVTFLMVHASNHLAEAEMAKDLAEAFLYTVKEIR